MIRIPLARRAASFGALLFLVLAALTFVAAPAYASLTQAIEVDLVHGFTPSQVNIATGTTVLWQSIEKTDYPVVRGAHTVTSSDDGKTFDSGEIEPGASFSFTFLSPGTFTYRCKLHPQLMAGALTVTGPVVTPAATEKTVNIVEGKATSEWGYAPADLVGTVGLTVTWRNLGAQGHTVTADGLFDSGNIAAGGEWKKIFDKPISATYYCTFHTFMTGTIRIAKAGAKLPPPPVKVPKSGGKSSSAGAPAQPSIAKAAGPLTFHVNMVEPSNPDQWGFAPSALRARIGDTIVWTNQGASPHTATATDHSFDSGQLAPGASFAFRPRTLGTFAYVCVVHPWMKASIQIVPVVAGGTDVLGEQIAKQPQAPGAVQSPAASPEAGAPGASEPVQSKGRVRLGGIVVAALLVFGAAILWPALLELRAPRFRGPMPSPSELVELPHAETRRVLDLREPELTRTR
jgi:plastocyanin